MPCDDKVRAAAEMLHAIKAAAETLQRWARGLKARRSRRQLLAAVSAVVALQRHARGFSTRLELRKEAELQWISYCRQISTLCHPMSTPCLPYVYPTSCPTSCLPYVYPQEAELQWISYYVSCGKYAEARELGWEGTIPDGASTEEGGADNKEGEEALCVIS